MTCGAVMPYVTVGRENTGDIQIHYQDHGSGAPVVLIHGYLADACSWEKQEAAVLPAGYRIIAYDGRGGGASSLSPGARARLGSNDCFAVHGTRLAPDKQRIGH